MSYYLSRRAVLKLLEKPSVYQIAKDELHELDAASFRFLKTCVESNGCSSANSGFIDYCLDRGILTSERVSVRRPALVQSAVPSLRYLELQITDACNLRCRHCYLPKKTSSELAPSAVRALLASFEEMQGLRVIISGGEPLLHSTFDEINELLPDFLLRKVLFTNGLPLTKEVLKRLKVDEILVSIDGLEDGHDAVRGAGTFRRSMKAVHEALDAGFDVSVSTMVHRRNLADFDRLESILKDAGVRAWFVDVPCPVGRLKDNPEFLIRPEEGGKYLGYGFGRSIHSSGNGYGCGLHMMAVTAEGKMARCALYADRPSASLNDGLKTAWSKVQPVRLADLACDCVYVDVCRGGCRYRAEMTGGKKGKDPYRCNLYGVSERRREHWLCRGFQCGTKKRARSSGSLSDHLTRFWLFFMRRFFQTLPVPRNSL